MRLYFKLLFVFSSYAPLFLIAGGKCLFTDSIDAAWGSGLIFFGGLGFIVSGMFLLSAGRFGERYVELTALEEADGEVLIYVLGYLPIIVTAGLDQSDQVFSVLSTYLVIFSTYVLMNKVYVNPLFLISGLHLYKGIERRGANFRSVIVITREENFYGSKNLRLKEVSAMGLYFYGEI